MPKRTITKSKPMTGEAFCAPVAPAAHAEPFVLPHDVALAAEEAGMVRTLTLDEQIEKAQAQARAEGKILFLDEMSYREMKAQQMFPPSAWT